MAEKRESWSGDASQILLQVRWSEVRRSGLSSTRQGAQKIFYPARGAFFLAVYSSLLLYTLASSGDRSPAFQSCLLACYPTDCASSLPLSLRLTGWSCQDDCAYRCSHTVTDAAEASLAVRHPPSSVRIEQFYGKWAFWRLWGMQEPASVAFSILNLRAHVKGIRLLQRRVPQTHPMRWYYIAWSLISMNAWAWSAVFHTRGKHAPCGLQLHTSL